MLGYQYWREYLLLNTKVFIELIARNDDTHVFSTYTQETVKQNADGAIRIESSDNAER